MLKKLFTFIVISSFSIASYACIQANSISLTQVTKDVSFLASDNLKGRGNFSADIKKAANYIAMRFKESGLTTVKDNQGFVQKYKVTTISPSTLRVNINGKTIAVDDASMFSNMAEISWNFDSKNKIMPSFTMHSVTEDDDIRATLAKLNQQGGQHLVLINPSHKDIFNRFSHYFNRGLTKLENEQNTANNTIIMVLTNIVEQQISKVKINGVSTLNTTQLSNIVAVLPGKSKPQEVVLFSAHYDHLGVKKNTRGDVIYNGADDDASGTAAIINLAEHFAKQGNNARTLMFAAFSAEEIGGFGSRYFSQQFNPDKVTAMINIEMIGKPSIFGEGTVWMTGMSRSDLGEQLNNALESSAMRIYEDPYPEQNLFYRSDNATLARLGVPAHSFSSTQLDKDEHYHQVSDDINSLNLPSLHKAIQTLAIATQPLVDGTVTPSRIDVNKVKSKGLIY